MLVRSKQIGNPNVPYIIKAWIYVDNLHDIARCKQHVGYKDIQYQTTIGWRDKCQPKMNGLWRFHTSRKHFENNSYKETFVHHECNALEFGTVSPQKEVNNDNFPFLVATKPMKSCHFPTSLQYCPQKNWEQQQWGSHSKPMLLAGFFFPKSGEKQIEQ